MKLRTIIIGGAVLSILAGYGLGKTVLADSPAPGSSADPVVSKSYVDKAVQDRISELEKTVAELSVQAQALQNTINDLQAKVNKTTPAKTTTPSSSTSSNTQSGTTTNPSSTPSGNSGATTTTPVVGKTCYVISTNNYVNLRSGPSTDTTALQRVNKGEPMLIQQVKDSWYEVRLSDGKVGWVASWVVEIK